MTGVVMTASPTLLSVISRMLRVALGVVAGVSVNTAFTWWPGLEAAVHPEILLRLFPDSRFQKRVDPGGVHFL
jgi:hypothetical protein